jgi:hypothetical protein
MAMFHQRKGDPPPPELCHRCLGRMGTSYLSALGNCLTAAADSRG